MARTYEIDPRPDALGGGWKLRMLVDGQEAGGGVFPALAPVGDDEFDQAYQEALDVATDWLAVE